MGSVTTAAGQFSPEACKEWAYILIPLASPGVGEPVCHSGACLCRCCALRGTAESKDFCVKQTACGLVFP